MLRAQRMLEASSKRAMSSTTRVASLVAAASSERREDGRVLAGAVEGLLHGDDGGVFGALLDEVDHGIVGVVGVVEQDVVVAQLVEDVGGLAAEDERPGREGLELEVGAAARRRRRTSGGRD